MGELELIAAFCLVLVFVLWVWLRNHNSRKLKISLLIALPLIYLLFWQGLVNYSGWPMRFGLPDHFELLDARIVEPNRQRNEAGVIFIWALPEDSGIPRSYSVPYDRDLHDSIFEALQKISQGKRQMAALAGRESGHNTSGSGNSNALLFKTKPPVVLPPK